MASFGELLSGLEDLRELERACARVYQYQEKRSVADFFGIDFSKLAEMEFRRWRRLSDRYARSVDQMFERVEKEGTPEERKTGLSLTRFYVPRRFCRG